MEEEQLRSILKCVRCGTCRSVCPIFEELGWESYSTRGRMMIAKGISEGMDLDESIVDCINACTTCGICEEMCPAGAIPPDVFERIRHEIVESGAENKTQQELRENTLSTGNPMNEKGSRLGWLREIRDIPDHAGNVYFVGCLGSYRYQETVLKTYDLISGLDVTVLADEVCCGSPLLRTGSNAGELIEHNVRQMEAAGAHTIIASCAGCYNVLKNEYPDRFRVVHVTEFLAENLDKLELDRLDITVTYHDPCHLGRANRIFDAPRELISAVCELKEMKTSRENARCCGGGGGVRKGYPELSRALTEKRVEEVPEGVDYIVTCCPLCRTNMESFSKVPVIDLLDLLTMAGKVDKA